MIFFNRKPKTPKTNVEIFRDMLKDRGLEDVLHSLGKACIQESNAIKEQYAAGNRHCDMHGRTLVDANVLSFSGNKMLDLSQTYGNYCKSVKTETTQPDMSIMDKYYEMDKMYPEID